jgi:hypothetical protein
MGDVIEVKDDDSMMFEAVHCVKTRCKAGMITGEIQFSRSFPQHVSDGDVRTVSSIGYRIGTYLDP